MEFCPCARRECRSDNGEVSLSLISENATAHLWSGLQASRGSHTQPSLQRYRWASLATRILAGPLVSTGNG